MTPSLLSGIKSYYHTQTNVSQVPTNILRAPKVSCYMPTLCIATQQLLELHRQNDVDKKEGGPEQFSNAFTVEWSMYDIAVSCNFHHTQLSYNF